MSIEIMEVQTSSEATIKSFNFLKEHKGQAFTYKAVADELGFDKTAKVLGSINGLKKKGLVVDGPESIIDGKPYKTIQIADNVGVSLDVTFVEKKVSEKELSDKAVAILRTLSDGKAQTSADLAALLNTQAIAVTGSATSLVKKGLLAKNEASVEIAGEQKKIVQYTITDAGLTKVKELI